MPRFIVDKVVDGSKLTKEELAIKLVNMHRVVVHDETGHPRHLEGGEATIWRAGLDGEFAVKAFRENTWDRATKEFKCLQMLQSSNYVPRVYGFGRLVEDDGVEHLAIAEEYVRGVSLAELVSGGMLTGGTKGPRLNATQTALVAIELAKGIRELNKAGLAHRDISCNNVLIGEQSINEHFSNGVDLRLVDFGTSTDVARTDASVLSTGARLATIPYGAPEIFGGAYYEERRLSDEMVMPGRNSQKTDVWSIGAIIVFLMWGEYWPEELEDIHQMQRAGQLIIGISDVARIAHAKQMPIDLVGLIQRDRVVTQWDREMADVVQSCTQYKPSMRLSLNAIETTLLDMIEREGEADGNKKRIPSETPALVQVQGQIESPKTEERIKDEESDSQLMSVESAYDSIQASHPFLQQRNEAISAVDATDVLDNESLAKSEPTTSLQTKPPAELMPVESDSETAVGPQGSKIIESLISEAKAKHKAKITYKNDLEATPWENLIIKRGVLIGCDSCPLELVVPDGITKIGKEAFKDKSLKLVVLPESVTHISNKAFYGCHSLRRVVMPEVTIIGDSAFEDCTSLRDVEMPAAKKIGCYAFKRCEELEYVEMPAAKKIKHEAFFGCTQLRYVEMKTMTRIGLDDWPDQLATDGLINLEVVRMPAAKEIPSELFDRVSSLKAVDISGANRIGYHAFWGCTSLVQVDMSSARRIGERAFFGCSSLDAVVPMGATYMLNAFDGCQSVKRLNSEADLIGKASLWEGRVIRYSGSENRVSLPNRVTSVGESVFARCNSLEYVDVPGVKEVGEDAFRGCKSLRRISMPSARRIDEHAFYGCSSLEAVIPVGTRCKPNAFDGCCSVRRHDTDVDKDDVITLWGGRLIRYSGRSAEITLPQRVTSIGDSVFARNSSVKGIIAPAVRKIEKDAFNGCGSLKRVDMPAARIIGGGAFCGCKSLESLKLPVVKVIGYAAFSKSYGSSDEMIPHAPMPLSVIVLISICIVLPIYETVAILIELLG